MRKIRLIPKTHKAKNIIKERGNIFFVHSESENVIFSNEDGPWLLCVSLIDADYQRQRSRWINQNNDVDFDVEMIDVT